MIFVLVAMRQNRYTDVIAVRWGRFGASRACLRDIASRHYISSRYTEAAELFIFR